MLGYQILNLKCPQIQQLEWHRMLQLMMGYQILKLNCYQRRQQLAFHRMLELMTLEMGHRMLESECHQMLELMMDEMGYLILASMTLGIGYQMLELMKIDLH